jgi:hypothetical protein
MKATYLATDHTAWEELHLKDYSEYGDCVEYINQRTCGDECSGNWYYADEENNVIYHGSFGNYNSPGADCYTYAIHCDTEEEFLEELKEFKDCPEWVEEEEPEEDLPCEEDYITTDHTHFYQYGKLAVTVPMEDEFMPRPWQPYVKKHMEENNFYPSVWLMSDHGNLIPLLMEEPPF